MLIGEQGLMSSGSADDIAATPIAAAMTFATPFAILIFAAIRKVDTL
jgi:hypothetical protein